MEGVDIYDPVNNIPVGEYKRVAVKVIDPRGNEAMRVLSL
jgi:hypothetical protein